MNNNGAMRQPPGTLHDDRGAPAGPTAGDPGAPAAAVLDPAALEGLRQLDPSGQTAVLQRVLGAYQQSLSRHLVEMRRAFEAGDGAGLMRIAHTLKSSSAAVGALALSRHCAELEETCRSAGHASAERVEALIHEAQQVVRAVADILPG